MDVDSLGPLCDVLDLSNHKPGVDLRRFKDEGWAGLSLKATEGDYFTDRLFRGYLDQARAIDLPVFGYHWQVGHVPIADQVALVKRVVPRDCPLALDAERYTSNGVTIDSGGTPVARALVSAFQQEGYTVKYNYLPYWHWVQLGRPDLTGLPPTWGSSYGPNNAGGKRANLPGVAANAFDSYGGVGMAMLQYTSTGQPGSLDFNVARGTAEQFRAYLYDATPPAPERRHRSRSEED